VRLGVWVLLFLAVFTVIAWRLNAVVLEGHQVTVGPALAGPAQWGPAHPLRFAFATGRPIANAFWQTDARC
jgi:hypothetical protein